MNAKSCHHFYALYNAKILKWKKIYSFFFGDIIIHNEKVL